MLQISLEQSEGRMVQNGKTAKRESNQDGVVSDITVSHAWFTLAYIVLS